MNKRGFTLVELLAVIVIMAIILTIAIPSSIDAYKKSKLKAEYSFVKRLSEAVDNYTTLNTDKITFTQYGQKTKIDTDNIVTVYKGTISTRNLVGEELLNIKDYINPNNKDTPCNKYAEMEIYKDSDFVYRHKIKVSSLSCITNDYINEYLDGNNNSYIIDTCVWKENN